MMGQDTNITEQQLAFQPENFFALGSPIGMFYTMRSRGRPLPPDYRLPSCPNFFNIIHPLDPVAYRIEPLLDNRLSQTTPELIEHHAGMRTVYKLRQLHNDITK